MFALRSFPAGDSLPSPAVRHLGCGTANHADLLYLAFCLCPEIEAKAIGVWDQAIAGDMIEQVKTLHNQTAEVRFYAGLFFLRNWQTAKAIDTWELVLSSQPPDIEFSRFDYSQQLSGLESLVRIRLVTFFLKSPKEPGLWRANPAPLTETAAYQVP